MSKPYFQSRCFSDITRALSQGMETMEIENSTDDSGN